MEINAAHPKRTSNASDGRLLISPRKIKRLGIPLYIISFRVVRFKLSDSSIETVLTNLDFPPDELKHLYAMRRGIETSFRELKYTIGLSHFHVKRPDFIL